MKNIEKRIRELENFSSSRVLPILRLVRETNQTVEEVFKAGGHPGKLADYLVICREIIRKTSRNEGVPCIPEKN
jgi:hypothetical protein